jgi:ceramide glucosyltransferase
MAAMETLLLVLLSLSGLVLFLFMALTVAFRRGGKAPEPSGRSYPFVSLLKPVKGVVDGLAANLESFYHLDYPGYEILFAVDNLKDPCVGLLRELETRHPGIATTIVAAGHSPFENPKVHKLALMESRSRGSLIWATDSDVRAEASTLRRLVDEHLARDAKVVFSPIRGSSSRTFGSLMENSGFNFFTSGGILASWVLGRTPILVGKSMLIDRIALETLGCFGYFKNYLAEDFLIGETFAKSGYRVSTNCTWVTSVSQTATPASFFRRISRWAKLRFHLRPPVYFLEILLNPIVVALAGLPAFGSRGWAVLAFVTAGKIALEYANFLCVNTGDRRKLWAHLAFPAAVVAKDLIVFAAHVTPLLGSRVEWRGGRIAIGRNTRIIAPATADNFVYEGA